MADDALAAFYGPVGAKLELVHHTIELVRQERETREADQQARGRKPSAPGEHSWRHTYEQKLVQANIDSQNEIADIIESNLHYIGDDALRGEAMQYLVDARMDQWCREAEDIDVSQTIIEFPTNPRINLAFIKGYSMPPPRWAASSANYPTVMRRQGPHVEAHRPPEKPSVGSRVVGDLAWASAPAARLDAVTTTSSSGSVVMW